VLIDSSHRKWGLVTGVLALLATAAYFWLNRVTPGGLTGGRTLPLWYGIIAFLLMVFAGLLALLRRVPSWWWIGSRRTWLRAHIWLSLLAAVLVLCHSGVRWGGPLEQLLWVVFTLTLATGLFGLVVQQFVPRMLTARLTREVPYEQIPHLCQLLRRQADALAEKIKAVEFEMTGTNIMASQMGMGAVVQFSQFYEKHIRLFLSEGDVRATLLANPLNAEEAFTRLRALPGLAKAQQPLAELQRLCEERRQLPEQEHLHHWLHGWLLLHVPISVALLLLVVLHAVSALYF
jgi:hypothetical protein